MTSTVSINDELQEIWVCGDAACRKGYQPLAFYECSLFWTVHTTLQYDDKGGAVLDKQFLKMNIYQQAMTLIAG